MTIYAKRLNPAQRRALTDYEGISGFEPMHQEDLDDGTMTFREVWNANIKWPEDMVSDVVNISTNGCGE